MNYKRTALLLAATGLLMNPAHATLIAHYDADADTASDNTWEDEVGSNDLGFTSTSGGTAFSSTTDTTLDSTAYSFPASTGTSPAVGASTVGEDIAYFQGVDSMSIDLSFKVDSTTQKAVLFSTGGGARGVSLSYDNGSIRLLLKSGGASGGDSTVNLLGAIAADETSGFVNVVVTIDNTNDEVYLYVDGALVASDLLTAFGDFTGNKSTSIAMYQSQVGGADGDNIGGVTTDDIDTWDTNFLGDIEYVKVYDSILDSILIAHYDADADTAGDNIWEDEVGSNDLTFTSDATNATPVATTNTNLVSTAYSFPVSGGTSPALGAAVGSAHFQGVDNLMTIDLSFKVSSTIQKAVLFSTGGSGRGLSLSYDNGGIRFLLKGDGAPDGDANVNLLGAIAADETSSFIRAFVTVDAANGDVFLYVDGVQVASYESAAFGGNFTGDSATTIASKQDAIGGADRNGGVITTDNYASFANNLSGDIEYVKVYRGIASIAIAPPELTITNIELTGGNVVLTTNVAAAGLTPQISQDLTAESFADVDGGMFSVTGTNEITIDSSALTAPSDFLRLRD